jgi:hypothetical protein
MQISRAHFCSCLDNQVFERLGRYEVTLWRQTAQILLLLSVIEFRAKGRLPDERPCFGRVRRKHERYPPFDFNPFLRSAGRWRYTLILGFFKLHKTTAGHARDG